MDGGVVSFVVQSTENPGRFQDCTFTACSDSGCELNEECYITIPLQQGGFRWSGQWNSYTPVKQLRIIVCIVLCRSVKLTGYLSRINVAMAGRFGWWKSVY